MASSSNNPQNTFDENTEDIGRRLSDAIFGPSNYPPTTPSQTLQNLNFPPPNYLQNPNFPTQTYPQNLQNVNYPPPNYSPNLNFPSPYFQQLPQDLNFFPQPSPRPNFSSGVDGSSTTVNATASNYDEIQEEPQQTEPIEPPSKKKRKSKYTKPFWRFYEMTLDDEGNLISGRCKVRNCKAEYFYSTANGTNTFSRHVEKHIKAKEEPQEHPDRTPVQTLINPDGTRTHQRYDEKRMLSEFAQYNTRRNTAQPTASMSLRSNSRSALLLELDDDDNNAMPIDTNELQSYLALPGSSEGVDVLDYWKKNANLFPTLSTMARDIFAIPISTVPSESCFSSANRILTDRRSRLGPKVFERLVCLKDWIDADDRREFPNQNVQETSTDVTDVDSDDEYDPDGENPHWYLKQMHNLQI